MLIDAKDYQGIHLIGIQFNFSLIAANKYRDTSTLLGVVGIKRKKKRFLNPAKKMSIKCFDRLKFEK